MQDVFKTIVETEKDAEKKIQEARTGAAEILGRADSKIAEKIRLLKQEEREKTTRAVEEAEQAAEERLQKIQARALEQFEKEKADSSLNIQKLVDRVVERITMTVFDGRQE